jgi:O-methyltransferase involved in polyketide biosynthesis
MRKSPMNTSSISFTAFYTAHVWFANGLSDEAFHTRRGSLVYHVLAPLEYVGKQLMGGDIKTALLQRHCLIDHRLTSAIEQEGVEQVLEIACGLSPRGYRYCRRYHNLKYVEADLPDMAARKYQLLSDKRLLSPNHRVVPLNIFSRHSADALETVIDYSFKRDKPLLVITEGLVNYFSLATISPFWKRLQQSLAGFPLGIYLTDNYPLLKEHPFCRTLRVLGFILGAVSRSEVSFHFGTDEEGERHFRKLGFQRVSVHDPSAYGDGLHFPSARGSAFVRIIEARTGRNLQKT